MTIPSGILVTRYTPTLSPNPWEDGVGAKKNQAILSTFVSFFSLIKIAFSIFPLGGGLRLHFGNNSCGLPSFHWLCICTVWSGGQLYSVQSLQLIALIHINLFQIYSVIIAGMFLFTVFWTVILLRIYLPHIFV